MEDLPGPIHEWGELCHQHLRPSAVVFRGVIGAQLAIALERPLGAFVESGRSRLIARKVSCGDLCALLKVMQARTTMT
jgi:hypothetical protein